MTEVANTLIGCGGQTQQGIEHTTGYSIGGGAESPFGFLSLGFEVTNEVTTATSSIFTCDQTLASICAIHYVAVTAVTVQFWSTTIVCGTEDVKDMGIGTVFLPNANHIGSLISRAIVVRGRDIIQCRGYERQVDFNCGPRGGPEWFQHHENGPWSDGYLAALDPPDCPIPIEAFRFTDGE